MSEPESDILGTFAPSFERKALFSFKAGYFELASPFALLTALRLICWYTGELEGHDVLVRAGEHLRRSEAI